MDLRLFQAMPAVAAAESDLPESQAEYSVPVLLLALGPVAWYWVA
jgi:hypothetical protein